MAVPEVSPDADVAAPGSEASLVASLVDAQAHGRMLAPVDIKLPMDRAYAVQRQVRSARLAAGDRLAGHKIGLSSHAARASWDAAEPVSGHLLAGTIVEGATTYSLAGLATPRVEAEIAFLLGSPLGGKDVTEGEVIAATNHLFVALEIVASRWVGGPHTLGHLVADNVNAVGVLLGPRSAANTGRDGLDHLSVTIEVGDQVTRGCGSQVYGHPARAVAWLARHLTRVGERLEAGDLVMSGSLNVPLTIAPGDVLRADFDALGTITTTFTA